MAAVLADIDAVLDRAAFAATPLVREPFDHLVLPGFVRPGAAAAARAAFPQADYGGLAPAPPEGSNDGLGRLLDVLRDRRISEMFGEKFGLSLDPQSLMITLRRRCRPMDGRIHVDSETKVVTALIYLNESWPHEGGRLRLLRNGTDLDDMIGEVTPLDGTLIVFRRGPTSWHGHHPFDGVRRAVMFNWMTDAATARRELRRHSFSLTIKKLFTTPAREDA